MSCHAGGAVLCRAVQITQMKFRLSEGSGECFYYLGVEDDGYPRGLEHQELQDSIAVIHRMAVSLQVRTWLGSVQPASSVQRTVGGLRRVLLCSARGHQVEVGEEGTASARHSFAPFLCWLVLMACLVLCSAVLRRTRVVGHCPPG